MVKTRKSLTGADNLEWSQKEHAIAGRVKPDAAISRIIDLPNWRLR